MVESINPEAHYFNQSPHGLRPIDIQPQLAKYKAPKVRFGMLVSWYRYGHTDNRPSVGIVTRAGDPFLEILVPTEAAPLKESVPHVSDPRLRLPASEEGTGSWDYTEEYRVQVGWMRKAEARLADLERAVKKD